MSNDLLKNLTKNAGKKTEKPAPDRPTVEVPAVALEAFQRLVGANAVLEVAEARKEAEESLVKETMLDAFGLALWRKPLVTLRPFNELVNDHYEGEGKNRTFVEATEANGSGT
jgi:hypothetical protein